MNTVDNLKKCHKEGLQDIIFIDIQKKDFDFIEKDISVPVLIKTIKKDKNKKSISIDAFDILIGLGYLKYGFTDEYIYKNLGTQILEYLNDKDIVENILIKSQINPVQIYLSITGLLEIQEDNYKLLDARTILSRYILENNFIKDLDEILLAYREDLTKLLEKTGFPRYGFYLGKSYEATNEKLRARLIYQKILNNRTKSLDKKYKSEYNEVVGALDSIFQDSEIERIEYLISYGKYEEAERIIKQMPDSKIKLKCKISILKDRDDIKGIVKELDKYMENHGKDLEIIEYKHSLLS